MIKNNSFFCSWSGGKDSCLALYYALREGGKPSKLVTMLIEDGKRSRSHGLSLDLLKAQAQSLNIPLYTCSTSWLSYEENFSSILRDIKKEAINFGIFGDIDLEDHKAWVERVCSTENINSYLPLWQKGRREIVEEFINLGFKATIVAVKDGVLDNSYLGKELDNNLLKEFEKIGIDACGENGEFHTVVTDGPIFSKQINIKKLDVVLRSGYWFLDIAIDD